METTGRKLTRVIIVWMLAGALIALIVVRLADRSGPIQAEPRRLDNIELLATATTFDRFQYTGTGNLLRGNFFGSISSDVRACQASRTINFFKVGVGSVPDLLVATSISDNTGNTGNFTSTEWHDPPNVSDFYYAVVEPDEAKDCAGVTSETIEVV